jgi:hypothetical protein
MASRVSPSCYLKPWDRMRTPRYKGQFSAGERGLPSPGGAALCSRNGAVTKPAPRSQSGPLPGNPKARGGGTRGRTRPMTCRKGSPGPSLQTLLKKKGKPVGFHKTASSTARTRRQEEAAAIEARRSRSAV